MIHHYFILASYEIDFLLYWHTLIKIRYLRDIRKHCLRLYKIWKFPEHWFPSVQKEKSTRYAFSFSFDSFVPLNAFIVKKIIQHEKCATDFDSAIKLFVPPPLHLNRPLPPSFTNVFRFIRIFMQVNSGSEVWSVNKIDFSFASIYTL